MKVLVLGGNRFFGRRLVSLLLERSMDVTILNRGLRADNFGERVRRIRLDRKYLTKNHPEILDQRWDIVFDQICYDAVEAKLACEVFQGKTSHYVFISSQSVYAPGKNIKESVFDPYNLQFSTPVDRDTDYGEAKRQAEATFFQMNAFPVTAVRFPIVLGEDDYTERLKQHVNWIQNRTPIFFPNIDAKISFIQSSDAARFLAGLTDRPLVGAVNCCSPDPIQLRKVVQEIERAVGVDAIIADKIESGQHSPFGIESDWYMETKKIQDYGFSAEPIKSWLPSLIEKLK